MKPKQKKIRSKPISYDNYTYLLDDEYIEFTEIKPKGRLGKKIESIIIANIKGKIGKVINRKILPGLVGKLIFRIELEKIEFLNIVDKTYNYKHIVLGNEIISLKIYPQYIPIILDNCKNHSKKFEIKDLEKIAGFDISILLRKLKESNEISEKINLIETYFEKVFFKSYKYEKMIGYTINSIVLNGGDVNLEKIANKFGMSLRNFRRIFQECIGVSPKKYLRILRFQNCIPKIVFENRDKNKLRFNAVECGFYDQSHFNKEVKKILGMTLEELKKIGLVKKCF